MTAGSEEGRARDHDRREEVLDRLEDAMAESHRKVMSGRMQDPTRERARANWHNTLASLANAYRLLAKDQDLEEIHERLDELEAAAGDASSGPGSGSGGGFRIK